MHKSYVNTFSDKKFIVLYKIPSHPFASLSPCYFSPLSPLFITSS